MKKLVLFICMMLFALTISAQQKTKQKAVYDTIPCKNECIVKLVEKQTTNGNPKVYAVYNDKSSGISDIISIPKTTVEYMMVCKEAGITPTLGIKLRNGQISSIIKIKKTFKLQK